VEPAGVVAVVSEALVEGAVNSCHSHHPHCSSKTSHKHNGHHCHQMDSHHRTYHRPTCSSNISSPSETVLELVALVLEEMVLEASESATVLEAMVLVALELVALVLEALVLALG